MPYLDKDQTFFDFCDRLTSEKASKLSGPDLIDVLLKANTMHNKATSNTAERTYSIVISIVNTEILSRMG